MFQKLILCLLISILFCQCYSKKWTRIPDKNDIPLEDSLLLFHWENNEMAVANAKIIEDQIYGYIRPLNFDPSKSKKVHIYLDSTFEIDKNATERVAIPLKAIENVKTVEKEFKPIQTTFAVIGLSASIILLVGYYQLEQHGVLGY